MRSRLLASTGALAFVLGSLLASADPAIAAPAHCAGWTTHPKVYNSGGLKFGNGAAIMSGPYTDCVPLGRGYPADGINVHCGVVQDNDSRWIYVIDTSTGIEGWTRHDALTGYAGAVPDCYVLG